MNRLRCHVVAISIMIFSYTLSDIWIPPFNIWISQMAYEYPNIKMFMLQWYESLWKYINENDITPMHFAYFQHIHSADAHVAKSHGIMYVYHVILWNITNLEGVNVCKDLLIAISTISIFDLIKFYNLC